MRQALWSLVDRRNVHKKHTFVEKHGIELLEHARVSPRQFYRMLELEMKHTKIPSIAAPMRFTRLEAGLFHHKRECLRIRQADLTFDVCAAFYGTDFYISWRLRPRPIDLVSWILILPALLQIARRRREPQSDYERDHTLLFEKTTRRALERVMAQIASRTGVRRRPQQPQSTFVP